MEGVGYFGLKRVKFNQSICVVSRGFSNVTIQFSLIKHLCSHNLCPTSRITFILLSV